MALARVKVWIDGEVLFAADQNGEFNNILNNPIALISPTTGTINFNLQGHSNLLPTAITATSGSVGQTLVVNGAGAAAWRNMGQGSRVRGLTGTVSSQIGTFTADQYLLQTTDGTRSFGLISTTAITANVGTAGPTAGGRDIAGSFASTYVHWYAISTGLGSTAPAGLVSTAAPPTGPVMPSSYSAWVYLGGSLYSSASTTCPNPHHIRGSWYTHDAAVNVLSGGTSTSEASITTSTVVPTNTLQLGLNGELSMATNGGGSAAVVLRVRFVSGNDAALCKVQTENASNLSYNNISPTVPSTSLLYIIDTLASSANVSALNAIIQIRSYQVPNGGE